MQHTIVKTAPHTSSNPHQSKTAHLRPILQRVVYYGGNSILAAAFLFPLVWTAITAFKPTQEAAAAPPTFLPTHLSLENFASLVHYGDNFSVYLRNSVLVVLMTIAFTVTLSTFAGFGFSRFRFRGKNTLFIVVLATLMIPFQSLLIPLFLVLKYLGLQNSLLGLALVYTTFHLPFSIFVMRNSFDAVPREIEEAAYVDGCTPVSLLYRLMLVLVRPGLVTVALYAFFTSWNEFLAALIFMHDPANYTLPIQLINVQAGYLGSIDWGALQAGVLISMVPSLVVFLVLQRYYVQGLAAGAVRG